MTVDPKNLRLFDRRVVERNIKKGLVTRKDYEKHLKSLEDTAEKIMPADERKSVDVIEPPLPPLEPPLPAYGRVDAAPRADDLDRDDELDEADDLDDEDDEDEDAEGEGDDEDEAGEGDEDEGEPPNGAPG